ncbi:hypothetical protein Tco_1045643 [Tanacetum coccineum]|uniref:Uncharacterized protein n=1 Tax=Tanacetum coccineum TaxID=301880 RepID=A0ABQ5GTQ7_9ASTR
MDLHVAKDQIKHLQVYICVLEAYQEPLSDVFKLFSKGSRVGLVPDPVPAAPYVPPTNKYLEILFQPKFDEYFEHPSVERLVPLAHAFQVPVVSVVSSGDVSSAESTQVVHPHNHLKKWSKDHPLDNVIVPKPDCVMIIALKWIYKVKLDEYGDVLKNKARSPNTRLSSHEAIVKSKAGLEGVVVKTQGEMVNTLPCLDVCRLDALDDDPAKDNVFAIPQMISLSCWITKVLLLSAGVSMSKILDYQLADIFTKALPRERFRRCSTTAIGNKGKNNMANENVPTPSPTRSDDQILPFAAWISVDILQNTNFFRALTASASVPAIYLQQFWDTIMFEAKTGAYRVQLDEDWFILDVNLLREALEITPIDQDHQFVTPPSIIQTFLADKGNLGIPSKKGKKTKPQLFLIVDLQSLGNLKFIPKGKTDEVFGMQICKELITDNIRNAPYYNAYSEMVAKHGKKIKAEEGGKKKADSKAGQSKKPTTTKQPKLVPFKQSNPAPATKPKVTQENPSMPSLTKHPKKGKVQKVRKGKSSLKLIDEDEEAHGQAPVGGVAIHEQVEEATRPLLVRQTPASEEASTGPSAQPQDDASANIVRDSPSLADAKTGADTDITTSTANTEAGLDPGKIPESRPPPEHEHMDED